MSWFYFIYQSSRSRYGLSSGGPGEGLGSQTEARRAAKKVFGDRAPPPYLRVWMTAPPAPLSQGLESSNTVRSLLKEIWRGKIPYVHFIANSIPGGAKIWSDAEERKGDLEFQESEIVWCRGLFFPVFGRWISFTFPSLFNFFLQNPPSHNPVRAFNRLLHVQLRSVWKEEELLIFCPQWSLIVRRGSKTNRIRW